MLDLLQDSSLLPILILTVFVLVTRLAIYLTPIPQSQFSTSNTSLSFIIPSTVAHARFLPKPSSHKFKYPALFLALELNALENSALDLGKWFKWKGNPFNIDNHTKKGWSVLSILPTEYLRLKFAGMEEQLVATDEKQQKGKDQLISNGSEKLQGSILLKLVYELRSRGYLSSGPQDQDWGEKSGEKVPGWRSELGQVWSITMPCVLGFQGINPLTVYYCYRPAGYGASGAEGEVNGRGPFWLAILEVHNTFSERHVYILESNVDEELESTKRRKGYQHQWTFERSFHVSPFNDRGGFYCLMMNELFQPSKDQEQIEQNNEEQKDRTSRNEVEQPEIGIRLLLLVNPDEGPSTTSTSPSFSSPSSLHPKLQKKLIATLNSHPSSSRLAPTPLSALSISTSLLRQPLDLFLTTFRILWEAGKLHFVKKLDAFGRPDMMEGQSEMAGKRDEMDFDGVGLPPVWNSIEARRSGKGKSGREASKSGSEFEVQGSDKNSEKVKKSNFGGLLWPSESWIEKVSRETFMSFITRKLESAYQDGSRTGSLKVTSTDEAVSDVLVESKKEDLTSSASKLQNLIVYIRSPSFYTDVLMYPTVDLALLFGSRVGRRWGVNDLKAFRNHLSADDFTEEKLGETFNSKSDWKLNTMNKIRARHLNWSLERIKDEKGTKKYEESRASLLNELIPLSSSISPNSNQSRNITTKDLPPHPYSTSTPLISFNLLLSLFLLHLFTILEFNLFRILKARYVAGTEPWLEISRGLELLSSQKKAESAKREEKSELEEMDFVEVEKVEEQEGREGKQNKDRLESGRPSWLSLGSVRRE